MQRIRMLCINGIGRQGDSTVTTSFGLGFEGLMSADIVVLEGSMTIKESLELIAVVEGRIHRSVALPQPNPHEHTSR